MRKADADQRNDVGGFDCNQDQQLAAKGKET